MEETYTPQEDYYGSIGTVPTGEEKQNVHTFLHNVAVAKDTTKLGYLTSEEVGIPKVPLRTYKELEVFCKEIMAQQEFGDYFRKKAEVLTSTSLSKDAKLISLAVIQKREVSDVSKPRVVNKGWFKSRKKDKLEEEKF